MISITDILNEIRAYRTENKLSVRQMALRAGMNVSTLRRMRREDWNPTAETIGALQDFIRCNPTPESIREWEAENHAQIG